MSLNRRKFLQQGLLASPLLASARTWAQVTPLPGNLHAPKRVMMKPIRWKPEVNMTFSLSDTFKTSHAPSLATYQQWLYMAFTGKGGSTLWTARCTLGRTDYNAWSTDPQDYQQVKVDEKAAKIDGRPCCLTYGGFLLIIATDADRKGLTCYYYDGNRWASAHVPTDYPKHFGSPVAAVVGDQLHIFVSNEGSGNALYHVICKGKVFDEKAWTADRPNDYEVTIDAATPLGDELVLVGHGAGQKATVWQTLYRPSLSKHAAAGPFQEVELDGSSPFVNDDRCTVFAHDTVLGYIYREAHGEQLYYAYAGGDSTLTGNLMLKPSTMIPGKSSELPGCAVIGNDIVLAYKGQSSENIYLLAGSF